MDNYTSTLIIILIICIIVTYVKLPFITNYNFNKCEYEKENINNNLNKLKQLTKKQLQNLIKLNESDVKKITNLNVEEIKQISNLNENQLQFFISKYNFDIPFPKQQNILFNLIELQSLENKQIQQIEILQKLTQEKQKTLAQEKQKTFTQEKQKTLTQETSGITQLQIQMQQNIQQNLEQQLEQQLQQKQELLLQLQQLPQTHGLLDIENSQLQLQPQIQKQQLQQLQQLQQIQKQQIQQEKQLQQLQELEKISLGVKPSQEIKQLSLDKLQQLSLEKLQKISQGIQKLPLGEQISIEEGTLLEGKVPLGDQITDQESINILDKSNRVRFTGGIEYGLKKTQLKQPKLSKQLKQEQPKKLILQKKEKQEQIKEKQEQIKVQVKQQPKKLILQKKEKQEQIKEKQEQIKVQVKEQIKEKQEQIKEQVKEQIKEKQEQIKEQVKDQIKEQVKEQIKEKQEQIKELKIFDRIIFPYEENQITYQEFIPKKEVDLLDTYKKDNKIKVLSEIEKQRTEAEQKDIIGKINVNLYLQTVKEENISKVLKDKLNYIELDSPDLYYYNLVEGLENKDSECSSDETPFNKIKDINNSNNLIKEFYKLLENNYKIVRDIYENEEDIKKNLKNNIVYKDKLYSKIQKLKTSYLNNFSNSSELSSVLTKISNYDENFLISNSKTYIYNKKLISSIAIPKIDNLLKNVNFAMGILSPENTRAINNEFNVFLDDIKLFTKNLNLLIKIYIKN